MNAGRILENFSLSPLGNDKYSLVDPSLLSRFQLHVAAHPDPEASCVLAELFRAVRTKNGLFYARSLEQLDETSRDLVDQLINARLLNAFSRSAWDETHQLIAELPVERGGLALRDTDRAPETPLVGSLAWMRAWIAGLQQATRRRASVALAFASEHAGFDHFKYLWGAPAAAGVVAAFLGLVLLDEQLGLRRLIIESSPVTWLAETLAPDTATQVTDAAAENAAPISVASSKLVRDASMDHASPIRGFEQQVTATLPTIVTLPPEATLTAAAPPENIITPQPVTSEEVAEKTLVVASKVDRAAEPSRRVSSPTAMPLRKQVSGKTPPAAEQPGGRGPIEEKPRPNSPVAEAPIKPPVVGVPQIDPPEHVPPRVEPDPPGQPPVSPPLAVVETVKPIAESVIAHLPETALSERLGEVSDDVVHGTDVSKASKKAKTAEAAPDFIQRLQGRTEHSARSEAEDAPVAWPARHRPTVGERVARSSSPDRIFRPETENVPERPVRPDVENNTGKPDRIARPVIESPETIERVARPTVEAPGKNFDRITRHELRAAERIERRTVERVEKIVARPERLSRPDRARR